MTIFEGRWLNQSQKNIMINCVGDSCWKFGGNQSELIHNTLDTKHTCRGIRSLSPPAHLYTELSLLTRPPAASTSQSVQATCTDISGLSPKPVDVERVGLSASALLGCALSSCSAAVVSNESPTLQID